VPCSFYASLLAQPVVGTVDPGERHWEILGRLMKDGQGTGPLVMDAVLAALAVEHGATFYATIAILRVSASYGGSIHSAPDS
jgi:predicted nucleic acid-binding protein